MEKELFWADKTAEEIMGRKKFQFLDKDIQKPKVFNIKTSASLSGVLHIGRLSDTVRADSVCKALSDKGCETKLMWVAEDVDPLRKIPEGIPKSFMEYVGTPVCNVPDPFGCHKSYAEHFLEPYLKVLEKFVHKKIETHTMHGHYQAGTFNPFIKKIIENIDRIIEIQNRFRKQYGAKLIETWSPWVPICDNCGKIITTRLVEIKNGKIHYKCQDYEFEKTTAKGCGFEGENDPLKGKGKLMWKSEWAAQWAHWQIVCEGAGKEYQVPGSAFWINAEICERILDYPMPVPLFYEYLMVDGKKMSASLGNVVYPKDWLEVAEPEILRFFYNKKLMKTRSFSWKNLPKLYDEYDYSEDVYYDKIKIETEKEKQHIKRLYEISQIRQIQKKHPLRIPYTYASMVAQIIPKEKMLEKAVELLKSTGHIKEKLSKQDKERLLLRLNLAKNWAEKYADEQYKIKLVEKAPAEIISKLTEKQRRALAVLAADLSKKKFSEQQLYNRFFEIAKECDIQTKELFSAVYLILLGKPFGPRLAPFILAIGQKEVAKKLGL